jgi:hypothetical protein
MIECPEFRELLLYSSSSLREHGLIHRTALTDKIKETYRAVHAENLKMFFDVCFAFILQITRR